MLWLKYYDVISLLILGQVGLRKSRLGVLVLAILELILSKTFFRLGMTHLQSGQAKKQRGKRRFTRWLIEPLRSCDRYDVI